MDSAASIPASSEQPADDYALLDRIAADDSRALKDLYDRHASAVYTLALRILSQPQEAEQLLTDVFFEIWDTRRHFDLSRSHPLTFLMRLTRSRAIDHLRRNGPIGGQCRAGASLDPPEEFDAAANSSVNAANNMEESRARVTRVLAGLDGEQRKIIDCAYYGGFSLSQIAQQLNKPPGTVKSSIRLGLARLRDLLRPPAGEGTL